MGDTLAGRFIFASEILRFGACLTGSITNKKASKERTVRAKWEANFSRALGFKGGQADTERNAV